MVLETKVFGINGPDTAGLELEISGLELSGLELSGIETGGLAQPGLNGQILNGCGEA